jgi:hypothetical protein
MTVKEIKDSMTSMWTSDANVQSTYGLDASKTFEEQFSSVSLESIWFYVVAFCVWTLERLFDRHKNDVEEMIKNIVPHRSKWYAMKALSFMKDKTLIEDSDIYDVSTMLEEDITAAHVIKHAVAIESPDASLLTIKIAGESGGERVPLDVDTETQFSGYMTEIKDAGVRIAIINAVADKFDAEIDIYYDPVLLSENVETAVRGAIKNYIENLPFNGEYSNMRLVDAVQSVEGVKIVELLSAGYFSANEVLPTAINARAIPYAGYFSINNLVINMIVVSA